MKDCTVNRIATEVQQLEGSHNKPRAGCDQSSIRWDRVNLFGSYAAARKEMQAASERLLQATIAAFFAGCRELFETYPQLQEFGWGPGGFDEPYVGINADQGETCVEQLACSVTDFLTVFGEEFLRALFGVSVNVCRCGNIDCEDDDDYCDEDYDD